MNAFSLSTSAVAASIAMTGGIKYIPCAQCNTPIAELIGGFLIIRSRHHGEKHTTVLNLISLASGLGL